MESDGEDTEKADDTPKEAEHPHDNKMDNERSTPNPGSSERAPSLPPRPTGASLAPPFTTTTTQAISMPDLLHTNSNNNHNKSETTLAEIQEEKSYADEKADDVASVLSSSSRSTRFRMPSLRRRVTQEHSKERDSSITSSPRSAVGGRRSRRTSDVHSEDDAASLERTMGLGRGDRAGDGWGVGDEVVMGLD